MLVIAGTFRVPPAQLWAARAPMERMIQASRAEDGCLGYAYAEDVLENGLIRVTEIWRDRDCLERHLASEHIAEWRASWAALKIGERQLTLYEADNNPQPT